MTQALSQDSLSDNRPGPQDTHAFIVRIWHEVVDADGQVTTWRGYVEQVGGDQRLYFFELDALLRFVQRQAKLNAKSTHSVWKSLIDWIR